MLLLKLKNFNEAYLWTNNSIIYSSILTIVIVFSSRKPSSSPEPAVQVEQVITAEDVKIEKALEIINGGGQPMEGILMLKELADSDEPNLDAVFLLAQFSVKAVS